MKHRIDMHLPFTGLTLLWTLLVLICMPTRSDAHALGQSYMFLSIYENSVTGRIEIPIADLNKALNLGLRTDGSVTSGEIEPHIASVHAYLLNRLKFSPNGTAIVPILGDYKFFSASFAQYLVLEFEIDELADTPDYIDVEYSLIFDVDPDHRGLTVIENDWKSATFNNESQVALTFAPSSRHQRLELGSGSMLGGLAGMIRLGTHHIAIGIDHVLFILALLLPSVLYREHGDWRPVPGFRDALLNIVKIVTIFTIAHSITLSLAVLGVVEVPSRLVESVIALSIVLVALDIIVPIFGKHIWWLVFIFGLFHGFGFASVLSEMGIHSSYTVLSLLGFNIGVELGQLTIVCIAFPILFFLRNIKSYSRSLPYGATVLILVASYWFVERAFEVDLPAGQLANQFFSIFT